MSLRPRIVRVGRRTEYEELLQRHGTRQQAAFFLEGRGGTIDELADRHRGVQRARDAVAAAIPSDWRQADVERSDLHLFRFASEDIVVVIGQDGLVANAAKYLSGQAVVGVNPDPERNPGVLVPHHPEAVSELMVSVAAGESRFERRTMVAVRTDDGQELTAVNEVYFGHRSHQSARYRIELSDGAGERHSSSGVLAGTGTGATGWLRSVHRERASGIDLPAPESPDLCWFAREAWPSSATGTELTEGTVRVGETLRLRAESDELVCFGDGIERDALRVGWGQSLTITAADQTLNLVRGLGA